MSIFEAFSNWWTGFKMFFIKSSETDANNEAIVEQGLRDQKAKADKAVFANGQLNSQLLLLKEQVRKQTNKQVELKAMLGHYANVNDEINGANCADELATLESDLKENQDQLTQITEAYKANTEIIAESLRQIQKFQRDFEQTKTKVAISRNMQGIAELMKTSITELQGTLGGSINSAMDRMRTNSVIGQGQVNATMDVAKEMGANIRAQQDAKRARGAALFAEFKAQKAQGVQAAAQTADAPQEAKAKIAVPA